MPKHLPPHDNRNEPIVNIADPLLPLSYFNILKLRQGKETVYRLPGYESVAVVLSGTCRIRVNDFCCDAVGKRQNIWEGMADSVYAPPGAEVRIIALAPEAELAVAGGRCAETYAPHRIPPGDVETVEVGSPETHTHRRICHILGQKGRGPGARLLVSELFADAGCWVGYPPHKHDLDRLPEESGFEEIYHYRFQPEQGFGAQFVFAEDGSGAVYHTRQGSTVLIDRGYHPGATAPGYQMYYFTILVGKTGRSLVQYFHPAHRRLMNMFPGVDAMRDKFK